MGHLDAVILSPPYADIGAVDLSARDIERMKANEANGRSSRRQKNSRAAIEKQIARSQPEYGTTPGQLGALKAGDFMAVLDAVLCSPPYAESQPEKNSGSIDLRKQWETYRNSGGGSSFEKFCAVQHRHSDGYGHAAGQLGALKPGEPPVTTTASGVPVQTWEKCYNQGWKGIIVPEAYRHPAKFAYGLVQRILAFGLEQGFWRPGDVLGDPFGGVALGGILAGYAGLHWRGVELEPAFVALGEKNLALHRPKWARLGLPVTATLTQGDSRHFAALVGQCGAVLTSPPYAESLQIGDKGHVKEMQNPGGSLKSSQAYLAGNGYGTTPGQLGALPAGTPGGNGEPDTYWRAVAQIYQQVRLALKPGGVFVCVVKSFVKDGAIVDLPGQTAQLLTRLGFTIFLEVRALLTKETTHAGLFDTITEKKSRKSFFRRLCEKKGAPAIDWETVIFARKE